MNDWIAIHRYACRPAYIVTLACGHHRISAVPPHSFDPDPAVYEYWCDMWYQKAVRIGVIR